MEKIQPSSTFGKQYFKGVGVIVYVEVPKLVLAGWSAVLMCQFELAGETLHSLKWYKGPDEFFRYTPQQVPSIVTFNVTGINVDLSGSNMTHVRLQNVRPELSGQFTCEVSADKPAFNAATDSAHLQVLEIEIKKPQLLISSSVYRPWDPGMYINCSAQVTDPPPRVTFYLDDEQVDKKWVVGVKEGLWSLKREAIEDVIKRKRTGGDVNPKSGSERPIWIRCEARLPPSVYHLTSASVPVVIPPSSLGTRSGRGLEEACRMLFVSTFLNVLADSVMSYVG